MTRMATRLASTIDGLLAEDGWGQDPQLFAVVMAGEDDEGVGVEITRFPEIAGDLLSQTYPDGTIGLVLSIEGVLSDDGDEVTFRRTAALLATGHLEVLENADGAEPSWLVPNADTFPSGTLWQMRRILGLPSEAPEVMSPRHLYATALVSGGLAAIAIADDVDETDMLVPPDEIHSPRAALHSVWMFGEMMGYCTAITAVSDDWNTALADSVAGLRLTATEKRSNADAPMSPRDADVSLEWQPWVTPEEMESFASYLEQMDGALFGRWMGVHYGASEPLSPSALLEKFAESGGSLSKVQQAVYDGYRHLLESILAA